MMDRTKDMWGEVRSSVAVQDYARAVRMLERRNYHADPGEQARAYLYICEALMRNSQVTHTHVMAVHDALHRYASKPGFDEAMAKRIERNIQAWWNEEVFKEVLGECDLSVDLDDLCALIWRLAGVASRTSLKFYIPRMSQGVDVHTLVGFECVRNRAARVATLPDVSRFQSTSRASVPFVAVNIRHDGGTYTVMAIRLDDLAFDEYSRSLGVQRGVPRHIQTKAFAIARDFVAQVQGGVS